MTYGTRAIDEWVTWDAAAADSPVVVILAGKTADARKCNRTNEGMRQRQRLNINCLMIVVVHFRYRICKLYPMSPDFHWDVIRPHEISKR